MRLNRAMNLAAGDFNRLRGGNLAGYTVGPRTASEPTTPSAIDDNSWYTPRDVFRLCGVSECHQAEAREAGELTFTRDATGSPKCLGSWIARWISDGCPCEQKTTTAEPSATSNVSQKKRGAVMSDRAYENPEATLQERVDQAMAKGQSRATARHEALRRDPTLRRDLLAVANEGRSPQILEGIASIV